MNAPKDLSALRIDRDAPPSPRGGGGSGGGGGGGNKALLPVGLALLTIFISLGIVLSRGSSAPRVEVARAEATGGGTATGSGISANGYVVARTKASVSSKILGRLAWVGVTEGSRVRQGEVLARLEDADYLAAVRSAEATIAQYTAQLVQARREATRATTLRRDNLIPEAQLEDAQTQVQVLAAQLDAARAQSALSEANLENTRVRAPFAGTVLRKDAEVGEIVAPAAAGGGLTRTAIVTMADLTTLEVEVDVNEAYIAQVTNGQAARITLDAYPDTSFTGRVRQVVPTADRAKATVLVKVAILDRDPRILPEMGAKVVFTRSEAEVQAAPRRVLAPTAAVVQGADGASVWVVTDDTVRRVAVDAGPQRGEQTEIRSGLSGGESLVLDPPASLADGRKIRTKQD
jgi:RND family efflux transporter MFP subunit